MSTAFAYQKAASLISPRSQELSEGRRVTGRGLGAGISARCAGGCCAEGTGAVMGREGEASARALGW